MAKGIEWSMTCLQPEVGVGDAVDGRLEAADVTAELHVGGGLTGRAEARQALAQTPGPSPSRPGSGGDNGHAFRPWLEGVEWSML